LNRMESLQEASTRASRVSLLGKYLQAVLDVSALVNDKKVLNVTIYLFILLEVYH